MSDLRQFGKYEILGTIGRGGFATVYRARDPDLDRVVALKVLAPHLTWDTGFIVRFQQEARVAARLRHEHIITIFEIGDIEGQLYIAMECIEGGSLRERLRQDQAPTRAEVVEILGQIGRALDYAHSQGIIHRDVKPGNILLEERADGRLRAVLSDFGLVKALQSDTALTQSDTLLGTVEYMAPEQADLDRRHLVGPASDLYSLGVVAYHMLTGRPPFTGNTTQVLAALLTKEPPSPNILRDDLPASVSTVLLRALSKEPEARYPSAAAFVQALAGAMPPKPVARVEPETPTPLRRAPRLRPALLAGVLVLVLAAIAGAWLLSGGRDARFARDLQTIYFTSTRDGKRDIYRIDNRGAVIRITQTADPAESWSATLESSGVLYFTSNRNGSIEVYALTAGGRLQQVTETEGVGVSWGPVVAADGSMLFTSNESGGAEVYRLSTSGEREQITASPRGAQSRNPAPGDNGVLFFDSTRTGKSEVYSLDTAGTLRRVTFTEGNAISYEPTYTAQGGLFFTSTRSGKREIYRLRGGEVQRMTLTTGSAESWSPSAAADGSIYFTSNRTGKREVFRLDAKDLTIQVTRTPGDGESYLRD